MNSPGTAGLDAEGLTLVPYGEDYPEIRRSVREICSRYDGAYWRGLEDKHAYPDAFIRELTEAGFLSALIPEEYGGSGLPLRAGCVILEEINASGCASHACHAQMYMMDMVLRHGSDEQKQRYLPGIASGEIRFQTFGVSEPTSGSDTTKLKTQAVRDGDHYVVNGQKIWISRAANSDLMTLLVRTTPLDKVQKPTDGLSVLLVDIRESVGKGLTIRPIEMMVSHQTNELFFDNLRVPVENLIGEEGKGFRYILRGMNAERILVAAGSIGDARYFIDRASRYANERVIFGRPIGKNQGVQFPIARAYAEYKAADALTRAAAALFATGANCGEEANIARMMAGEAAWNAAEACLQTHGGFGISREFDIERKWRSARIQRIAPISTNLVLSFIGHHVLGMPKSY